MDQGSWTTRPDLRVALGAFIISFSGVYVKLVHVGPSVAGFYRVLFGGIILWCIVLIKGERIWRDGHTFALNAACGVLFALDLMCWHKSIRFVGPGLATILANFQVFILALFGIVRLGERLTVRVALSIALAILGLGMIIGFRWESLGRLYLVGLFLGLLTAGWYAAFLIVLRKIQSRPDTLSPMANLTVISLVSALFLALFAGLEGDSFHIPDIGSLSALICYGLFSQVAGWSLITKAIPRIRASLAGLLLLLQPALSFLWDIIIFHRDINAVSAAGVALTLCAIYMGTTVEQQE